jgi:hypothetical protein
VVLACALAACGGGDGGASPGTPAQSAAAALRFDNPQSQLALLAPAQADGDPSAALMRDTATGEIAEQVYVLADGSRVTVRTDAAGRLTYLAAGGYTFTMTDYTADSVTMTTLDPQGATTVEAVSLVDGSARALAEEPPAPPPEDPLDALVNRALEWTADVSNTHLIANIYRRVGESIAGTITRARQFGRDIADGAASLLHVDNEVGCSGADTAACGGKLADQATSFSREVAAMDAGTQTTAGFDVNASGIHARRDEWSKVVTPQQIEHGFAMTDVPCNESVFADMNPSCPQYVPPATGGGTSGDGTSTGGDTSGGGTSTGGGGTSGGGTSSGGGTTSGGGTSGGGTSTGGGGTTTGGGTSSGGTQSVRAIGPGWCVPTVPGVSIPGTYAVYDEPSGHPLTRLDADGTGLFEVYGAPAAGYSYQIRWCIESDANGTPLIQRQTSAGRSYSLVWEYVGDRWQGHAYDASELIIVNDGTMYLDDRIKK